MGVSPKRGHPKLEFFSLLIWEHEMFKVKSIKKHKIWPKFRGTKMRGFPPKRDCQNSNFLTADARHMKFLA